MRKFLFVVLYSSIFVMLASLNTGTVTPYATISTRFYYEPTCNQTFNVDFPLFWSGFKIVDERDDVYAVGSNVIFRRFLYFILSWSFMKKFGFYLGGLYFAFFLYISLIIFFFYSKFEKFFNPHIASLLTISFPQVHYYIGQPFVYNLITWGGILISYLLFQILNGVKNRVFIFYMFMIGLLFTGYDYYTWFIVPLVYISRQYKWYVYLAGVILVLFPTLTFHFIFTIMYNVEFKNSNTIVYYNVIYGYIYYYSSFFTFFKENFIKILFNLLEVFFYSTFFTLPFLFLLLVISLKALKKNLHPAIRRLVLLIIIGITLQFLFINLSPYPSPSVAKLPWSGDSFQWDMRGNWIARIYSGYFFAFILFFASKNLMRKIKTSLIWGFTLVTFSINLIILTSPYFKPIIASVAYHYYYIVSPIDQMKKSIELLTPKVNISCEPDLKNLSIIEF